MICLFVNAFSNRLKSYLFRPVSAPDFGQMAVYAFFQKNSNQADLYSFSGKIGTSVIPILRVPGYKCRVIFSCYMIDDDASWESIVNYYDMYADNLSLYFKVFDDCQHRFNI